MKQCFLVVGLGLLGLFLNACDMIELPGGQPKQTGQSSGSCSASFLSDKVGVFSQIDSSKPESCRHGALTQDTRSYHYEIDTRKPSFDIFLYGLRDCDLGSDLKLSIVLERLVPNTKVDGHTCTVSGRIKTIELTPRLDITADKMNRSRFCGRSDWRKHLTLSFPNGCPEIRNRELRRGVLLKELIRSQNNGLYTSPKDGFGFALGRQTLSHSFDPIPYKSIHPEMLR